MGLATAQLRAIYLLNYKLDLEYKIGLITETKMGLAGQLSDLLNVGSDLDPDSPEMKMLQKRKQRLHYIEKQLDNKLAMYKSRLSMINTELQSASSVIQQNIQQVFTYGR